MGNYSVKMSAIKTFLGVMCRDHACYGFDGWANLWEEEAHNVNERILLRDKPLQTQKRLARYCPEIYTVPRLHSTENAVDVSCAGHRIRPDES